jgi:hypothetical protein
MFYFVVHDILQASYLVLYLIYFLYI